MNILSFLPFLEGKAFSYTRRCYQATDDCSWDVYTCHMATLCSEVWCTFLPLGRKCTLRHCNGVTIENSYDTSKPGICSRVKEEDPTGVFIGLAFQFGSTFHCSRMHVAVSATNHY